MNHQDIITINDVERFPILQMRAQECSTPINADDAAAVNKMISLMNEIDYAAGIAAPQIGYPKRIFVLKDKDKYETFINPVIISVGVQTKKEQEGCLSFPGWCVKVERPTFVKVQYYDTLGGLHESSFNDIEARAIFHEMDHLNGVLLSEHLQKQIDKENKKKNDALALREKRKKFEKAKRKKARR